MQALLLVLLVAIIGLLIGVIILGVRSDKDNNSSSTLSSSAAASAPPGTTLLSSSMEAPAGCAAPIPTLLVRTKPVDTSIDLSTCAQHR